MVMLTCVYFLGACSPWILTLTEDPGEVPTAGTLPHRYDKVTIFFSLSFIFPFIYHKMCLYLLCLVSCIEDHIGQEFFKILILSYSIVLIWLGHFTRGISWFFAQFHTWLVLSLSASNDFFLHHFTPGLFRYSLHTMSFTLFHTWPISCLADPEVLWLWGRRMPGRGQVCRPAGGRTQIFNAKGQVWGILCRVHSGTYIILILM